MVGRMMFLARRQDSGVDAMDTVDAMEWIP